MNGEEGKSDERMAGGKTNTLLNGEFEKFVIPLNLFFLNFRKLGSSSHTQIQLAFPRVGSPILPSHLSHTEPPNDNRNPQEQGRRHSLWHTLDYCTN